MCLRYANATNGSLQRETASALIDNSGINFGFGITDNEYLNPRINRIDTLVSVHGKHFCTINETYYLDINMLARCLDVLWFA